MNSVPTVFCESVADAWKCCDQLFGKCKCDAFPLVSAPKTIGIILYLSIVDGRWRYGFTNPDFVVGDAVNDLEKYSKMLMSMEELKTRRNLKHIRIKEIEFCLEISQKQDFKRFAQKALEVDIQQLLNFACCFVNRPRLQITSWKYFADADSDLPNRKMLKAWIEKWHFSLMTIAEYTSFDDQLLVQKLFSKRKPSMFYVLAIRESQGFLEELLKSGQLNRFSALPGIVFPFEVMERLIRDFVENPAGKKNIHIEALFDETTPRRLEEMHKEGLCELENGRYYFGKRRLELAIWFDEEGDNRHVISVAKYI